MFSNHLKYTEAFTQSQLRIYVPFLDEWSDASPHTFAFISGVLPPAVSGLFGFFLPIIMRWLTQVSRFALLLCPSSN